MKLLPLLHAYLLHPMFLGHIRHPYETSGEVTVLYEPVAVLKWTR
jgi:hypothetical protein